MKTVLQQIAILVLSFTVTPLWAAIIRVPADRATIQAGINAASNGDTVVVYPGTYYENIFFRGNNIVLTSRFYETKDLSFIKSTVINGGQPLNSDTSSCVLIVNHENSGAILQGFTITGGRGTKWLDEHGAGTYREGGGILIAFSAPIIQYNLIINNEAANTSGVTSAGGGGIRAGDGNPKILNNVITTNKGRYGAGVVLNYTGATVKNNVITNNSGGQDYGGGALWMNADGSTAKTIENNTIAGNKTIAVYIWQGTSVIRNSIIWADSTVSAVQIAARSGGPTVTYSNVQGGWTGTGNVKSDPQFADSSFHLKSASLCIDAGDTTSIYNDNENILSRGNAKWPSRGILRNDIGAYGGPGASELPFFSMPTEVSSSRNNHPSGFRMEQNYPNPFNPSTLIKYELPVVSYVTIKVYDILGREVAIVVDEMKPVGNYMVKFDASSLPSGVYFYRLQAGSYSETKKLMPAEMKLPLNQFKKKRVFGSKISQAQQINNILPQYPTRSFCHLARCLKGRDGMTEESEEVVTMFRKRTARWSWG